MRWNFTAGISSVSASTAAAGTGGDGAIPLWLILLMAVLFLVVVGLVSYLLYRCLFRGGDIDIVGQDLAAVGGGDVDILGQDSADGGSGGDGSRISRAIPAAEERAEGLPLNEYSGLGDCCYVCIIDFEAREMLRRLPCGILLHHSCAVDNFAQFGHCPICRDHSCC